MIVQVINNRLGHFECNFNTVEHSGLNVFKQANLIWGQDNWEQYQIYHDGVILQTVINPNTVIPGTISRFKGKFS